MRNFDSKDSLKNFLLNYNVKLTGDIDELEEDYDVDEVISNKYDYGITEHLVMNQKERANNQVLR